ncbi:CAP domain-containing protein [Nocardioides marmoriginsengisoli]|uniref:CAP domain-containing protein n=1 Tax=Nocardioides marmoriginsengisoli TaxID=661483 RepID=A0A3N0CHM7_9ACTN|nr:CAP domain-containing protein [Nocardioides marmoriginsengisoli]RNL62964.1 CAP domain-containing protein [Nocardioides marmoriginsengisoli]
MRETTGRRSAWVTGAALLTTLMLGTVMTTVPADAHSERRAGTTVTARWSGAVNTTSRDAVNAAYWAQYAPKQLLNIDWLLGSLLGCLPGLTSASTNAATLSSLNFVRSLAGLAPVTFSRTLNDSAQKAALIMAANGNLSHNPSSSWKCWSSAGAKAAGRSNLALAYPTLRAGQIIDLYMDDPGATNAAVGHRRWLLNPFSTVMGSGSTSTANALTVMGPTSASRPNPRWVGWPTAGHFPNAIEPRGRWSLSSGLKSVSFARAKVAVYLNGTTRIPVRKYAVHTGYAQPTLVWQMPANFSRTAAYRVIVTGIKKAGVRKTLRAAYTVRLFTPSR